MRTRTLLTLSCGAAVVILAGSAMTTMLTAQRYNRVLAAEGDQAAAKPAEPAVRVEVAKPEARTLNRTLRLPASIEAYESADLFAKTSGFVDEVLVDIGRTVTRGDVLLTIDVPEMGDDLAQSEAEHQSRTARTAQAEAQVATAQAEVHRARADFDLRKVTRDRKQQLFDETAIPQQELDEAQGLLAVAEAQCDVAEAMVVSREADVRAAQAAVATARAKLARTRTLMAYATIPAPFDGVITARHVHPGAFVRSAADGATGPLLSIARVDTLRVTLEIPESDAPFVAVGTPVELSVRAASDELVHGEVSRVAWALRPNTRTMRVEVDLPNPDRRYAPGMYAQVSVTLESRAQALMVPSKAIRVRGRELSVWAATAGIASALPVTIGYDDGIWAEVLSGLTGNEQVIVAASGAIAPGAPLVATSTEHDAREVKP